MVQKRNSNSVAEAKSNQGRTFKPETLTTDEVRGLLAACSRRAPTGIRNRALLAVLYTTGLRISEALALRPKDVDTTAGTLTVLHGKGDKRRVVGVPDEALVLLERWMDTRRKHEINGKNPVFCTLQGGPVSSAYIRTLLPRLARKAGIDKRVHAHGLRHSHAAALAADGVPVMKISEALGHSNVSVTDRYIRHLGNAEAVEVVRSRAWGLG